MDGTDRANGRVPIDMKPIVPLITKGTMSMSIFAKSISAISKLASGRARHVILAGVLAAGTLGGLAAAGSPAYAGTPHITAIGGPGVVEVSGCGYNVGASIRLEVLTPGLTEVLETVYVKADWRGCVSEWPGEEYAYLPGLSPYVGDVYVAADGAPGPTAWATVHVDPGPTFYADFFGCPYRPGHVVFGGYGFQAGDTVRVELLKRDSSGELGSVMDTVTATVDSSGNLEVPRLLNVARNYSGNAAVIADESWPGAVTVGADPGDVC